MSQRTYIKYLLEKTYRPFLKRYLSKVRTFRYNGLVLQIEPGVFHPAFFYSTRILVSFLKEINVQGKRILELGSGSALISMILFRRGGIITASDISLTAIANAKMNTMSNGIHVTFVHSDLFTELQKQYFDLIVINPPYFPGDPLTEEEHAWYCGNNFEYFQKLFDQLAFHLLPYGKAYMILSEDCNIEAITNMARNASFEMKEVYRERVCFEWNYIYDLVQLNKSDVY